MDVLPSTEVHHEDRTAADPAQKAALTPPTSEDMDNNKREGSSSELSELDLDMDDEDDIGEIEPDHYYGGGKVPVFKPTMDQFRSFKKFIDKIDKYGMKSGIVKVIPPKEWRDSLPALDEAVKAIKVKNPITQDFSGRQGQYTQQNIEKQRSYNLPQWKALTEELDHQPPAKRGERRRAEAPPARTRATRSSAAGSLSTAAADTPKRSRGRPPKSKKENADVKEESPEATRRASLSQVPPTPKSPEPSAVNKKVASIKKEEKPRGRQPKSISARRRTNRNEVADEIDEEAFRDFDYHLDGLEEFTAERCQELEQNYWKTINFGQPMYGADMPGSLFDESTASWNVAKLENLLDVLGTKVPGVNTAYLYLGMWKATFAWHLEDVDLYSINYIHFGAPKQWYSISQEDARKFEAAMARIWPNDAKNCSQFLRHKTYLISPARLEHDFGIKVNKLVHYEGEFVLTYPYGYHSGYNLGYNCAESVNFATEQWLEYGRIAKKCNCEDDSVWVDVAEIERKLRGEPTPEYYEETDEEDDEDEGIEVPHDLPSPPASVKGKSKVIRKRKRAAGADEKEEGTKIKRVKLRIKVPRAEPCVLCPNDIQYDVLLPTDTGKKAHRLCALYTPETFIVDDNGKERVCNVANIDKARLDLKCNFCRIKRGACFQCSSKKCTRAFHATCAAAGGVQIDTGPVPTFDEDGTEYWCEGYDFRCRYHRPKRAKNTDVDALEDNKLAIELGKALEARVVVQAQYLVGEAFAGVVVENRPSELSVIIDVLPDANERIEVEWKYLLALDPAESLRPKPSKDAKPLPDALNRKPEALNARNQKDGPPEADDPFGDPAASQKWAEFHTCTAAEAKNPFQKKVDLSQPDQPWHYLGKTSTEARAQYTGDPKLTVHNPKSNFLDTVKPPPKQVQAIVDRRSLGATYP
ncbi:JmjC-domain-containing protein, partial [Saccharata proteae CBS 121410]